MTQTVVRPRRAATDAPPAPRSGGGRWARRLLVALAVLVVAAGAGAAVVYAPATAVDRVDGEVADTDEVAAAELADEVRRVAGVAPGDPWLLVDPAAVRQRIAELPSVASVGVRRTWPDTVTLRVAPRRTVAFLDVGGVVAEVAPGGRVGRVLGPDEPPSALVGTVTVDPALLTGGVPAPGTVLGDPVRRAVLVVEQLPVDLRAVLADGRLGADGSLEFVLRDGGRVLLGDLEGLPAKVHSIRSVLTGSVDRACLATLDVRRPDRPTITRRSGCDIDAPTVDTTVVARPSTTVPSGAGSSGSTTAASTTSSTTSTTSPSRSPSTASSGSSSTASSGPSDR